MTEQLSTSLSQLGAVFCFHFTRLAACAGSIYNQTNRIFLRTKWEAMSSQMYILCIDTLYTDVNFILYVQVTVHR